MLLWGTTFFSSLRCVSDHFNSVFEVDTKMSWKRSLWCSGCGNIHCSKEFNSICFVGVSASPLLFLLTRMNYWRKIEGEPSLKDPMVKIMLDMPVIVSGRAACGVCTTVRPVYQTRGRRWAILAYEISWFLFDFPVISLKNDVIRCKSGWG